MCGFAGIFSSTSDPVAPLPDTVDHMCARIAHRGPDDAGRYVDEESGIALGFRRLSIIDVSPLGHQPMASTSGRYVVVFNGEVYNYLEIRATLESEGNRSFRGGSDTEVILAAFERWGIRAAVQRFTGMFAMAIWDREVRELTLVRDRLGIKPLYVYERAGVVLFGSELKALLAHPRFDRELDRDALTSYFRYLYVPAPHTIFRHARKLRAGCLLTIRSPSTGLPEETPYWSVEETALNGSRNRMDASDAEMVDELERHLKRAVSLRMRSDVPLGALLSGGIDSSTVVAFMQEASATPVHTFCIGFDEGEFDESSHAAAVARHLGTNHTAIRLNGRDALDTVPRITESFDEPFADPSQMPSLLVCELARRDVTVALSGDGGDEIFAGYNRYMYGQRAIGWANATPQVIRRFASSSMQKISAESWGRSYAAAQRFLPRRLQERLVGEKVAKLGTLLAGGSPAGMYRSLLSAWQQPEDIVRSGRRLPDAVDTAFAGTEPAHLIDRMQLADQIGYLPDDLLAKTDRVSMAVSLEVRVPLIDHNVVEYSWRLPLHARIRHGRGKWILREVLDRRIPRSITERPKMGFSVPIASWLRGPLVPWAEELLNTDRLRAAGILDADRVERAWRALKAGHIEHAPSLWTVLMFEAWRERWSGSPTSPLVHQH